MTTRTTNFSVLHLNTLAAGGAFNAVFELHRSLSRHGIKSRILCAQDTKKNPIFATAQRECIFSNRTEISNTYFSLNFTIYPPPDLNELSKYDILNFHWISDWFDSSTWRWIIQSGKPVIWTLHDLRPLTGGCHFPAGCEQWKSSCFECPQLLDQFDSIVNKVYNFQQKLIQLIRPRFVAPSRWLQRCVETSPLCHNQPVAYIPYSIDIENYPPKPKDLNRINEIKKKWNISLNSKILLISAQNCNEIRKGILSFSDAWKKSVNKPTNSEAITFFKEPVEVVVVGVCPDSIILPKEWKKLGFITEHKDLLSIYHMSDALVFPSKEDNLPNVVMEAMACELPVLAYKIGGMPDLVSPGLGGWLVDENNSQCIIEALSHVVQTDHQKLRQMGTYNRSKICEFFNPNNQAASYIEIYKEILSGNLNHSSQMFQSPATQPSEEFLTEILAHACLKLRKDLEVCYSIERERTSYIKHLEKHHSLLRSLGNICERLRNIFTIY